MRYTVKDILVFGKDVIKYTDSYKYLGIEFQQNGTFKVAQKMRTQKAENATFQLASICSVHQSQSIYVIKKLFMAKIIPILL